jgi:hypothetical protein
MDLEDAIAEGNVQGAAKLAVAISQDAKLLGQLRGDMISLGDVPNPFAAWLATLEALLAALAKVVTIVPTTPTAVTALVPGTTPGQTGIPGMGGAASPGYGMGGYTLPQPFNGSYNGLRLAAGGVVTDPTMALIGEAGPEAVIPLNRMGSMGGNITYNIYATGIGDQAIAQVVQNALQELNRYGNSTTYAGAL